MNLIKSQERKLGAIYGEIPSGILGKNSNRISLEQFLIVTMEEWLIEFLETFLEEFLINSQEESLINF